MSRTSEIAIFARLINADDASLSRTATAQFLKHAIKWCRFIEAPRFLAGPSRDGQQRRRVAYGPGSNGFAGKTGSRINSTASWCRASCERAS